MSLRVSMFVLAALLVVAIAGSSAAQAPVAPPVTIKRLLSEGWDNKPESRRAADAIYEQFVDQNPANQQILYAYALAKMNHRQYAEAQELVDQYLASEPNDLSALRARAWLSMLLRDHARSLAQLDKLSQRLADTENPPKPDRQRELTEFLGRMFGYLEGPATTNINSVTLDAARGKVVDRLNETSRPWFEQGRAAVLDQYAVLATAKDDAQVQEMMAAEKTKRDTLANLDKEEAGIATRKTAIATSTDKLREEAAADTATFARADGPLADQLSRLSVQSASVESSLAAVSADIIVVRADAARERDPILRDRLLRELDRLELLAARLNADLLGIERRGAQVGRQRAALALRHRQLQAGFAANLDKLDKEQKALDTRLKRADAQRASLNKPATRPTGRITSLASQAQALTTYEAFPLEQEKQRLLDAAK
jgi:hypothetical protein